MLNKKSTVVPKMGKGMEAVFGRSFIGGGRSIIEIPIDDIRANEFQPRRVFNEDALDQLAHSIKQNGLAQPIVVRPLDSGYELIAGERRLRACKLAGFKTVPAIVKPVSDRDSLQLALVENLDREDLSSLEAAEGYQRLIDEFGYTHQSLGELFKKSRSAVSNTLRLLQLPIQVKEFLLDGRLAEGHARALMGLDSPVQLIELAKKAVEGEFSVRELERVVEAMQTKQAFLFEEMEEPKSSINRELVTHYFSEKGLNVRVSGKGNSGKLSFSFKTEAEFKSIITALDMRL